MESLFFRLTTFFLIFLDVIIVIVDLASSDAESSADDPLNSYEIIDLVLTLWFVVELLLRIVALTPPVFFAR